jgi:YD repeat-containing protein
MGREALNDEASGYFLIRDGSLPPGWDGVSVAEAGTIWGKGAPGGQHPPEYRPDDPQVPCCGTGLCMPVYSIHSMLVNLHITDVPLSYKPPRGPAVEFRLTYNHRESFQPQTFTYSNLGAKWTFDWVSYVEDDSPALNLPGQMAQLYVQGGGYDTYSSYDVATQSYPPDLKSRAVLRRTDSSTYERLLPDGSKEVFGFSFGGPIKRRAFMTTKIDPQGNSITLAWGLVGSDLRLVSIRDAIGQVTLLEYDSQSRVVKVIDPFGRFVALAYSNNRLVSVTDVGGITSSFAYGSGDFITKMTTPYGDTKFTWGLLGGGAWLETADPLGGRERVEYQNGHLGYLTTSACGVLQSRSQRKHGRRDHVLLG